MTTAVTKTTNIVPVQGVFAPEPTFALQYFVGPAGTPFFPPTDPNLVGVTITGSTINSTTIGAVSPSTGIFTNISTTTGSISTTPSSDTDIANKGYVDSVAQGLDVKASCVYSTTGNITLSGLATQANGDWSSTLTAGDRILVKNQSSSQFNGIYVASASAWARSSDMNTWSEVPSAFTFIEAGTTLADTGWVSTANQTGTIDVTAMPWSQFSGAGSYLAGTGLNLTGNTFSIANTGVTATAYGSASQVPTFTVNAQGQLTLATNASIAIAATQITSGTIDTARLSGSYTGITGLGTLVNLSVTNTITGSISGNAATATLATNATYLAGGVAGSVPYQSSANVTALLAPGSNGQVLTLASGLPSWVTPSVGTVTSIAQSFTGGIISVGGSPITTSGTLALTVAGTSGGIPYFSSGTTWASSAVLAANALMVGGGAAVAPSTVTTGTGVVTALGVNTGTAGAFVVNGGVLGTPSSGTVTNLTGTASININGTVGATTVNAGYFSTLSFTGALTVNASTGTTGQVLTSAGSGTPTWSTPTASVTVTDDTTSITTRYPLFANQTTGSLTNQYVSSTKLQYLPSTGVLTSTGFAGAGTGLTGTATSLSIGGTAAKATNVVGGAAGSLPYQTAADTTAMLALGTSGYVLSAGASAPGYVAQSSLSVGSATNATNVGITDDTTLVTDAYLTWVTTTTGNLPVKTSSTKLRFNPSTSTITATNFAGNASTATSATTAGNVTGTVAIANGGSGQTTAQAAMNAFAGATTSGYYLRGNGTNVLMSAIQAADVPTLNQSTTGTAANITASSNSTLTTLSALSLPGSQVSGNISGNAANVTGTVAIGNGGTGQTTAGSAFNALSPITTTGDLIIGNGTNSATRLGIGTNGYVLTSNGTTASWAAASGGVSQIIAGTNVTISPAGGTGAVTINASGGGGSSAYTRTSFTATAGQTAFTVTYAVGYLQVYVNGVLLATSDYTATSGTDFTLGVACAVGDIVEALVITTSVTGVTTGKAIAMSMIFGY